MCVHILEFLELGFLMCLLVELKLRYMPFRDEKAASTTCHFLRTTLNCAETHPDSPLVYLSVFRDTRYSEAVRAGI